MTTCINSVSLQSLKGPETVSDKHVKLPSIILVPFMDCVAGLFEISRSGKTQVKHSLKAVVQNLLQV